MKIKRPPRFSFSQLPTPIERLPLSPDPKSGVEIYIKRDDLTGSILSGNKVRKLEFLFYDLINQKSNIVITCGGVQSNHCRAVASLCATAGIECYLVLKGGQPKIPDGNLLISMLSGAKIKYVTVNDYERNINGIMASLAKSLKKKGRRPYVIPEGGTDLLGIWGYIKAIEETKRQLDQAKIKIDAISVAVGSGGTYAGLYLGCKLLKWDIDIIGYAVCRDNLYFQKKIFDICSAFEVENRLNLQIDPAEIIIDDRFIGPGYAKIGRKEVDFIKKVAQYSGVILDPAYTSKALIGLFGWIAERRFRRGAKVLFIHTGGQLGLFPQRLTLFGKTK